MDRRPRDADGRGVYNRGMARPTKLSPQVQTAICESVRGGAWVETAAEAAGVHASTVRGWIRRAEDHPEDCGPEFLAFLAAYKKARADAELEAVGVIRAAAGRSWQAAAWYLERPYPDRWGRRVIATEREGSVPFLVQLHNMERLMGIDTADA